MTSNDDAVTVWIRHMKAGNRDHVAALFERYFHRLVALAASRLKGRAELVGYEEDVALSAFKSLCAGAELGRFPQLNDRDALWKMLAVMTVRKAIDLHRKKLPSQAGSDMVFESMLDQGPSPEEVAEVSERVQELLDLLGDEGLKRVALWKVEGMLNSEIATRLNCVERTVERKLHQIRAIWEREII